MSTASLDLISVLSISLNVILIIVSVGLTVANWKADRRSKSQVKIWMEHANGINEALKRIIADRWQGNYSSLGDIASAVYAVQAPALSLWTSLYEERVLKEKEYKERQKKIWAKLDQQLGLAQDSKTSPETPAGTKPTTGKRTSA